MGTSVEDVAGILRLPDPARRSTANLRTYIQNIVSDTDTAKAHSRTVFNLPRVSADHVQIVSYTDTATCRPRAAYVFYVGSDTGQRRGLMIPTARQRMKRAFQAALVALLAHSVVAGAQADVGSARRQECYDAEQIFSTKRPIPNDTGSWRGSLDWARVSLPSCGAEAARVVAHALEAEGRNANPDSLRTFMYLVDNFRDATLFASLVAFASNQANTPQSRVWSLIALHRIVSPPSQDIRYELITQPPEKDGSLPCMHVVAWQSGGNDTTGTGDPLPPDAAAQYHDLIHRVLSDRTTPVLVHRAAICAG
jgi:hypothetical protein